MPDDQNTAQTTPEENSIPPSPTEPSLENSTDLGDPRPSVSVEELGADGDGLKGVEYDNIPLPEDSTPFEPEKTQENQAQNEPVVEPQQEDIQPSETAPEPETPQIPGNEALPESEPSTNEAKEEPKPIETPEPEPEKEKPLDEARDKPRVSYLKSQKWSELLVMARNAMQFRKRRKLDRIMTLFLKQSKITNDEVEKFLHVSDATASRYLSQLEKEARIKQEGKTGRGVSYFKI